MNITFDLQVASESQRVPAAEAIGVWLSCCESILEQDTELSIRIVDEAESAALNAQYRHKDSPTNVLSFPADLPKSLGLPLLGDLVLCAPVIEREAREQGKTADAHWAHMLVHGTLHLLGYDHIEDNEAEIMEALETQLIQSLGFPPPYEAGDLSIEQAH